MLQPWKCDAERDRIAGFDERRVGLQFDFADAVLVANANLELPKTDNKTLVDLVNAPLKNLDALFERCFRVMVPARRVASRHVSATAAHPIHSSANTYRSNNESAK